MAGIALLVHALGQGGTDRVAVLLASGFSRFAPTTLVSVAEGGTAAEALRATLDPQVERLALRGPAGRRSLDLIKAAPAWRRWLSIARPDVVLATGNNVSWFTAWGFARRGYRGGRLFIKTTNPILRQHDSGPIGLIRRWLYDRAFALADGILTLSEAELRRLAVQFPHAAGKMHVVANPYLTPAIAEAAKRAPALRSHQGRVVLAIGRLHRQKNFDLLLRAWSRLGVADARLVILGDGPDRAELETLAAELGIASTVEFAGFQPNPAPYLAQADLFVLSSRYEGLPAALIEAMAFDLPIVSTNCFEAAQELLGNTPGVRLVPCGDEAALARAISELLDMSERRQLRHIAARYTVDAAVRSHLDAMGIARSTLGVGPFPPL